MRLTAASTSFFGLVLGHTAQITDLHSASTSLSIGVNEGSHYTTYRFQYDPNNITSNFHRIS